MCSSYFKSELLLTGHVVSMQEIEDHPQPGMSGPGRVDVLIAVTESLKGDAGKTIVIHTNNQGSACGFSFEVGKDYFIETYQNQGEWWTGTCSHTHLLKEDDADVKWIHALPASAPGASIFGSIHFQSENRASGGYRSSPLPNVAVTAAGPQSRTATTDSTGNFKLDALPPGEYKVTAKPPEGDASFEPWTVKLENRGCAEANFYTRINGRIRGHVLFANGAPAGEINLTLENADAKSNQPWARNEHSTTSGEDGSFDFGPLDAGAYIFGANVDFAGQRYYRKSYFPSGMNRTDASPIELKPAQSIDDLEFNLPQDVPEPAISVQVSFVDKQGKPVPNGEITAYDDMWANSVTPVTQATDAMGNATILLRKGEYYNVSAFASTPDHRQTCAEPIGIWAEEDAKPITLIVSRPFGNCQRSAKPRTPKTNPAGKP